MIIYALALLIGVVAGLRSMTAPATASWTACLGHVNLSGSWLAFLAYVWTPWILTILAAAEFVTDQLSATPSRKVPVQFSARIASGALSGAAIGVAGPGWMIGGALGVVGAIIGTLGGASARARVAVYFGKDRPAALLEDAVALLAAVGIVLLVS